MTGSTGRGGSPTQAPALASNARPRGRHRRHLHIYTQEVNVPLREFAHCEPDWGKQDMTEGFEPRQVL